MSSLQTLRTKISLLIDDLERNGNISDVSGLYTALSLIDDMIGSEDQTDYNGLVNQVRILQRMPIRKAVLTVRLMTRQAYEDGIREGEKAFADAMIVEADEETAERILALCGQ